MYKYFNFFKVLPKARNKRLPVVTLAKRLVSDQLYHFIKLEQPNTKSQCFEVGFR